MSLNFQALADVTADSMQTIPMTKAATQQYCCSKMFFVVFIIVVQHISDHETLIISTDWGENKKKMQKMEKTARQPKWLAVSAQLTFSFYFFSLFVQYFIVVVNAASVLR